MGAPVVFDFSNGALSQLDKPTILTADDATVHSFGTQLNGPLAGQPTVTQDVAEATLDGSPRFLSISILQNGHCT